MEGLFAAWPIKLNPVYAMAGQLMLVYWPHFMRVPLLKNKLVKDGKKLSIENYRHQMEITKDNSETSQKLSALTGCHINNFEALIYFSAAVLSAMVTKVPSDSVEGFAGIFLFCRSLYTLVYVTPSLNGILRSVAFVAGLATTSCMFIVAGQRYKSNN
jgi:uncharacterized MAPEG superfamily protein